MKNIILSFIFSLTLFINGGIIPVSVPVVQAQILESKDVIGKDKYVEKLEDVAENSDSKTGEGFKSLADKITEYTKYFMIGIGIVILIYAALELMLSRGKEEVFKSKIQQIIYIVAGYTGLLLAQTIVYDLFFGEEGEIFFDGGAGNYESFAEDTFAEISGMYDYFTMFAIAVLLLLVIVALFRYMIGAEDDEARSKLQKQIIFGSIGILVLGASDRIIKIFFQDNNKLDTIPDISSAGQDTILGEIVGWTNFLLSYVAFGAIIAIIAAGASMVFFLGDDDRIEKGKSMIKYAVLALVVCFSAWVAIRYFYIPPTA